MTAEVQSILSSPLAPRFAREINEALQAEAGRRERFINDLTEDQSAEFINGEIVVHSPVNAAHSRASDNIFMSLKLYVFTHKLGRVGHEKLMVSLTRNDYEPDICFWNSTVADSFEPNQMRFPAPDLIVEILSPSTERVDRGIKMQDYAAHGVREYWLVDVDEKSIEQYLLDSDAYKTPSVGKVGDHLGSLAIRGMRFPVEAAFDEQAMHEACRRAMA